MSRRALLLLAGVAAALLLLTVLATRTADTGPPGVGAPLLSGLRADLADISTVRVTAPGERVVATLELRDATWVVVERDDWPADTQRLRSLLLALVDAQRIEPRTANPQLYHRLGVAALDDPEARGVGLTMERARGEISLIIGDTRVGGNDYSHVRRLDESAAWLVRGNLEVSTRTGDWLRSDIVDIPLQRVREVTILHPDGDEVRVRRDFPTSEVFDVVTLPAGRQLLYEGIGATVAGALGALSLQDVAPRDAIFDGQVEPVHTLVETWDGLAVALLGIQRDGDYWLALEARVEESGMQQQLTGDSALTDGDPRLVEVLRSRRQEADALTTLLAGRAIRVPRHTYLQLMRRSEELLAPHTPN